MGIGPLELAIVFLIVLVIFGPKRLPGLGRSLGTGMREFKDSISGKNRGEDDEDSDDDSPDELAKAPVADVAADTPPAATVEGEIVSDRRS